MRRREVIALLGAGAASSLARPDAAHAQQPALPVVGMLNSGSPDAYASRNAAFLQGLGEAGFIEGRNVAIEHRYADDHYDRLPDLAAELVRRPVAVLVASGGGVAPQAAKTATATIPIVFTGGFDPVKAGLVASLNQPGGNVTGATFLTNVLETKRLGLLHELVPQASVIGVLMNPKNASAETVRADLNEAARGLKIELRIAPAASEGEFDAAFAGFDRDGVRALLVASDAVFSGNAKSLVALAERHKLPAIYFVREFPALGGLTSYGTSFDDAWRQAGAYVGRILKGEKPANLPVVQSAKFEFVINLKTAKTLGLSIPQTLLATADEVIE
jgi:ABC-type uncharacterized transport system substrate-binding protein